MTVKENHLLLKDFEGTNQSAAWPPTYDPQPGAPKGVSWAILDSLGPESNSFGQGTWSFRSVSSTRWTVCPVAASEEKTGKESKGVK